MGVIKQGILGGFSGKVAGVVGSSWKGIATIKALPLSVANPKTALQIAQRQRFSNTVAFALEILSTVIKPLWDRFAQQMSGFNDFIKTNIDLFDAVDPSPVADLTISKGKMAKTTINSAAGTIATDIVVLGWTDDSGSGLKLATDKPFVVVLNVTTDEIKGFESALPRDDEITSNLQMDAITAGDVMHAYLAFRRADGTIVSNTDYKIITVS